MTRLRYALLILFICLPLTANAAVSSDDFPADTMWYMHADLKAMSTSESGRDGIYQSARARARDPPHESGPPS